LGNNCRDVYHLLGAHAPHEKLLKGQEVLGFAVIIMLIVFVCGAGMVGCPQYNVYEQRLDGEAQLAKAQAERQIQIQDAENKLQASKALAQVDVERAKGVAQANQIIGESLKDNEGYLRWLYIENLKEKTGAEVIYVPTEAGLPILEATRRMPTPIAKVKE
jgi:hypothetical protein